jgi:hypothetical protein
LAAKSVGDSGEAQFSLPDEKKRFFNQSFIFSRFRCCWQWIFGGFLVQLIIDLVFSFVISLGVSLELIR